jgi:regulator of replication initiation timing
MTDHTPLKEAAERATPGPWYRKDAESNGTYGIEYIDAVEGNPQSEGGFSDIANCSEVRFWRDRLPQNVEPDQRKANAHFIALANPSKILELLAENEALREAADKLPALQRRYEQTRQSWGKSEAQVRTLKEKLAALPQTEGLKLAYKDGFEDAKDAHYASRDVEWEETFAQSETAKLQALPQTEGAEAVREALEQALTDFFCDEGEGGTHGFIETLKAYGLAVFPARQAPATSSREWR